MFDCCPNADCCPKPGVAGLPKEFKFSRNFRSLFYNKQKFYLPNAGCVPNGLVDAVLLNPKPLTAGVVPNDGFDDPPNIF